eukprot:c21991_g3_i1.p1 GENE.c21991_g3_i1~~c21991_g3_i1.p1  ORF type:complete len:132 (-),score=39.65 c21991_g3_i1:47-442(-)
MKKNRLSLRKKTNSGQDDNNIQIDNVQEEIKKIENITEKQDVSDITSSSVKIPQYLQNKTNEKQYFPSKILISDIPWKSFEEIKNVKKRVISEESQQKKQKIFHFKDQIKDIHIPTPTHSKIYFSTKTQPF